MKTKIFIVIGVIGVLWYLKKKKDRKLEEKKLDEALKANELSTDDSIDMVRLKIDDWLVRNMPFLSEEERDAIVIDLTSNLDMLKNEIDAMGS